jgi:hypothetical protein
MGHDLKFDCVNGELEVGTVMMEETLPSALVEARSGMRETNHLLAN